MTRFILALCGLVMAGIAQADSGLTVQKVAKDTYAIVGPFDQRNPENLGNNATFGLVVTGDGAVLIDAGGSHEGAAALDQVVQSLTDQPVRYVVNTGGQDHRWFGNEYWMQKGAMIIAMSATVLDQSERASLQETMMSTLLGPAYEGTIPTYSGVAFSEETILELGGRRMEIRTPGPAHTPGDTYVWLPDVRTVFTGDIVYVGRILGVMDHSSSAGWLDAFDAVAALDPLHVVPGHGPATDLATAKKDTRDYLANLRSKIGEHIDAGGDIIGSVKVDQSAFAYLANFSDLAGRNAQEVFSQMEWE